MNRVAPLETGLVLRMNYPHPPSQLVYLLLGALRIADHRRTRPCRVSGFEVFATDEKQENNQQHVGFSLFTYVWRVSVYLERLCQSWDRSSGCE